MNLTFIAAISTALFAAVMLKMAMHYKFQAKTTAQMVCVFFFLASVVSLVLIGVYLSVVAAISGGVVLVIGMAFVTKKGYSAHGTDLAYGSEEEKVQALIWIYGKPTRNDLRPTLRVLRQPSSSEIQLWAIRALGAIVSSPLCQRPDLIEIENDAEALKACLEGDGDVQVATRRVLSLIREKAEKHAVESFTRRIDDWLR